jgi:GTPase
MAPDLLRYKAGYVAIIGEPNVGKSTLLNTLLDQKISIVSKKPQTTRQRVIGISTDAEAQIIFMDTPGILNPKYLLQEEMVKHVNNAMSDSDLLLIVVDVTRNTEFQQNLLEKAKKSAILVINKTDLAEEEKLRNIQLKYDAQGIFREIIQVSALKKINTDLLLKSIKNSLPFHQPYYPDDIISEHPERFFAAEFIREVIFKKFREEVPYSTAVEIREFKERDKGKLFIRADIIVEKESQKGIIIGNRGAALKEIGTESRESIEKFVDRGIFLELYVKVRKNWRDNETMLRELGYQSKKT